VTRQHVSSGGPYEEIVGYSRAVRVGPLVFVAGTTAAQPDGTIYGGDDAYLQAQRCFAIIGAALEEAGSSLADVVRVRMYVTDVSRWQEFGRAHREAVGAARPAATMVQVSALLDPAMLVEIEVEAWVGGCSS
jgi:enamine deaminase RidA (YjgF/YER057c/UK114 family)